jgi:hypothetical protein
MTRDAFDWNADGLVIIHDEPVTAIYGNAFGQVVIRQAPDLFSTNNADAVIVLDPDLVSALTEAAKALKAGPSDDQHP